tara:strand:+ start:265 stop:639 length:375 start_codon:yes stop_codon:yes gene_type:complete
MVEPFVYTKKVNSSNLLLCISFLRMSLTIIFFKPLVVFFIGICGIFLNRKNILILIMSIELVLLSINFNYLITSVYIDDRVGQIITVFILTIAAAETSIGLAILICFYRLKGSIAISFAKFLKG